MPRGGDSVPNQRTRLGYSAGGRDHRVRFGEATHGPIGSFVAALVTTLALERDDRLWNSIHRARDQSVLTLSPPRGVVHKGCRPREQSVAWAAGVTVKMSCRDPWDKIRLVLNLLGVPRAERAIWMPSAKDKEGYALEVVEENVVRVFNWIAIERNDFSLLLTGHASGVKYGGMLWAGAQQNGDFVSEQWGEKNYEVGKEQLPLS